jgi:penicillin-binding protein 2
MVNVRLSRALVRLILPGAMLIASHAFSLSAPEDIPRAVPISGAVDPSIAPDLPPEEERKIDASLMTQTGARTLALKVPAPRGQITDRTGVALAQNRVANYLALKLPYRENQTETDMLRYARQRVALAYRILGEQFTISDADIVQHYKNRRWLPLTFAPLLDDEQIAKITPQLDAGLILHPVYMRVYPKGDVAPHVIGYVGTKQKLPTGPVVSGDPLWALTQGRAGLESSFDADLEGTMGEVNLLFDTNGTQLAEEMVKRPVPGNNLITTLDAEMQATAERLLKGTGRNGAFVVLDAQNGDVIAMASWPSYDLNDWIPLMTSARYAELTDDPSTPLNPRAYQGLYPPASTFKLPVALAALEFGIITENDYFACPAGMQIGNLWKKNWNKNGESSMNVVDAIKRSCSTWFYTVGMKTGADNIAATAHQLGLGEKTGLPLASEQSGVIPNSAWAKERGIQLYSGHVANMSIGQGDVLATPVQVARMAAAIGNGHVIPRTRLVQQIQDVHGRVVKYFPSEIHSTLVVDQHNLDLVRQGMIAVVNGGSGTARAARNEYVTLAGKTGTGEWSVKENKRLAWFTGFVPAEAPRFAFAVVIEGQPGETIGGGKVAAPLVGEMFNAFYKKEKEGGRLDDYVKAEIVESSGSGERVDHDEDSSGGGQASASDNQEQTQPITEAPKRRTLFERLGIGKKKR